MTLLIIYLLYCINRCFFVSCITTSALNITDEMLFRQLNPNVRIVDIGIKKKICKGGNCHPEVPLDDDKLKRYRAYARFMTAGYCRSVLINSWKCGTCIDSSSPVKNTTDILAFHTKYHAVHGVLAVSHDLQRVFVVFQGIQHKIQWLIGSRGFVPGEFNTKFSNQSVAAHNIKVHSKSFS